MVIFFPECQLGEYSSTGREPCRECKYNSYTKNIGSIGEDSCICMYPTGLDHDNKCKGENL